MIEGLEMGISWWEVVLAVFGLLFLALLWRLLPGRCEKCSSILCWYEVESHHYDDRPGLMRHFLYKKCLTCGHRRYDRSCMERRKKQ